ncbi:centrosomal protein of 44 kDa-like isoform X4 [Dermacentor albipictus]|uniref:centrosomal protein of 44 kDa-like isoform X4 n=1 Tax=Dermacentor albipictus TaxID=60249 RepID=UPI0038FCF27A
MATGDIRNNLKMLSAEIRSVKTPSALLNLEGMMAGDPEVYLPIYDYLFQWYNTRLANEILRRDLKLPPYKHNRTKFLETMYLVLRELFQWKPPLSSSQFFSSGFAEKKIIMCRDIVKLIKEYSSSQKPASQAATSPASTASRPKAQKVPARQMGHPLDVQFRISYHRCPKNIAHEPGSDILPRMSQGYHRWTFYDIHAKSSAAVTKASLQPAAPTNGAVSREKPPSSKAVLSAKIDTLLHHLMEVQSSVKALKEQMLLVMNQTETMLDQVLPVVTEIVDELYKKEAADVPPMNSEQRHELDKGDGATREGRAASGVAETVRPKSEVLLD